jgi:hypothetical protein
MWVLFWEIQEKSSPENPPEDRLGIPQYKLSTSISFGSEYFDTDGQIQNNREEELIGTQKTATFGTDGDKLWS